MKKRIVNSIILIIGSVLIYLYLTKFIFPFMSTFEGYENENQSPSISTSIKILIYFIPLVPIYFWFFIFLIKKKLTFKFLCYPIISFTLAFFLMTAGFSFYGNYFGWIMIFGLPIFYVFLSLSFIIGLYQDLNYFKGVCIQKQIQNSNNLNINKKYKLKHFLISLLIGIVLSWGIFYIYIFVNMKKMNDTVDKVTESINSKYDVKVLYNSEKDERVFEINDYENNFETNVKDYKYRIITGKDGRYYIYFFETGAIKVNKVTYEDNYTYNISKVETYTILFSYTNMKKLASYFESQFINYNYNTKDIYYNFVDDEQKNILNSIINNNESYLNVD